MKDRADEVTRNRKYNAYQKGLPSVVYEFLEKKTWLEVTANEDLAKELQKPVIKKFQNRNSMPPVKIIFRQQM